MPRKGYATYSTTSPLTYIKWGAAVVVVLAFVALIYVASSSKSYLENVDLNPPLVEAPEGMVKERPVDAGGMEIPNQDKKVFDLLAQQNTRRLENSVDKRIAEEKAKQEAIAQQAAAKQVQQAEEEIEEAPAAAVVEKAAEVVAKAEPVKTIVAEPKPVVEQKAPVVSPLAGNWGVQLASFKSEGDAQKALDKFKSKFSELAALTPSVQKAEIAGRGTYYRARFMGLADKTEATNMCRQLKQKGQGCLHVTR